MFPDFTQQEQKTAINFEDPKRGRAVPSPVHVPPPPLPVTHTGTGCICNSTYAFRNEGISSVKNIRIYSWPDDTVPPLLPSLAAIKIGTISLLLRLPPFCFFFPLNISFLQKPYKTYLIKHQSLLYKPPSLCQHSVSFFNTKPEDRERLKTLVEMSVCVTTYLTEAIQLPLMLQLQIKY